MTIDPTCMVFKHFGCVLITTSLITGYSVVFVIYNAIYSVKARGTYRRIQTELFTISLFGSFRGGLSNIPCYILDFLKECFIAPFPVGVNLTKNLTANPFLIPGTQFSPI